MSKKTFENIIKFIELTLYLNNLLRLYNIKNLIFKLFIIKGLFLIFMIISKNYKNTNIIYNFHKYLYPQNRG